MEATIPTLSTLQIIIFFTVMIALVILCVWMLVRIFKDSKPISLVPAVFSHTIPPSQLDPEMDTENCSVDVIIVDADGGMFIGFYNYGVPYPGWIFIHDKFQPKKPFVWAYKPENFEV